MGPSRLMPVGLPVARPDPPAPGPTSIEGWFVGKNGEASSACFITIERLPDPPDADGHDRN